MAWDTRLVLRFMQKKKVHISNVQPASKAICFLRAQALGEIVDFEMRLWKADSIATL